MYELTVERCFSAAHAILIGGEREPLHGHDWRVLVTVGGPELDDEGLLCDFHRLEQDLDAAIRPFANRCLNDVPPFDRTNPTAELVARHLAEALAPTLPDGVHLRRVAVTEAPGCSAAWIAPAAG